MSVISRQNERFLTCGYYFFIQLIQFLFWPSWLHSDLALFPNRDVAAFLLEQEKWEEILRTADRNYSTPMRGLIAFMPGNSLTTVSNTVSQNTLVCTVPEEEFIPTNFGISVMSHMLAYCVAWGIDGEKICKSTVQSLMEQPTQFSATPSQLEWQISGVQQQDLATFQQCRNLAKNFFRKGTGSGIRNTLFWPIIECFRLLC